MKKIVITAMLLLTSLACSAQTVEPNQPKAQQNEYPWLEKYCMSFFTKTRSAKTVGKGRLSVSLKIQHFDWDRVCGSDQEYHALPSTDSKRKLTTVFCAKYGWADRHHLALGIPFLFNNFLFYNRLKMPRLAGLLYFVIVSNYDY